MTEKEAIYILRNAAWLGSNEERQKVEEAVEMAIEALNHSEIPNSFGKDTNVPSNDTISRKQAIDRLETIGYDFSDSGLSATELAEVCEAVGDVRQDMIRMIKRLPSAQPERKISNKEWIDFLVFQFDISRTSAKEMLHGMMRWKKEDNFKKQFNGDKNNGKTT